MKADKFKKKNEKYVIFYLPLRKKLKKIVIIQIIALRFSRHRNK